MVRLYGLLVIAFGIICNERVIGYLIAPDGEISDPKFRAIIYVAQLIIILSGSFVIYFRQKISKNQAALFLSVLMNIAALSILLIIEFDVPSKLSNQRAYPPRITPLIDYRTEQPDTSKLISFPATHTNNSSRNVVLISIDSMNHRQLVEALKVDKISTIRRFIEESVIFSRAYAHSPWTTPSHMSMLTGLHPSEHGRNIPYGLMIEYNEYFDRSPTHAAITETLADQGFDPVAFVGTGSISAKFGLGRGFRIYHEAQNSDGTGDIDPTLEKLSEWFENRDRSTPFFLFLHTYDFHMPRPQYRETDSLSFEHIDGFLKEVFSLLQNDGVYDESLIIFTSDHGSNMVAIDDKCCIHGAGQYEENLNVPLLIKLPFAEVRGESSVLVRHVDLFPTIIELLEIDETSYRGRGESLVNILKGTPIEESSRHSYSEADGLCALRYSLVSSRYKYIYTPQGAAQHLLRENDLFYEKSCPETCDQLPRLEEFFDVVRDPYEESDLMRTELHAGQKIALDELRHEMISYLNLDPQFKKTPLPAIDTDLLLDEAQLDALRTLGYME